MGTLVLVPSPSLHKNTKSFLCSLKSLLDPLRSCLAHPESLLMPAKPLPILKVYEWHHQSQHPNQILGGIQPVSSECLTLSPSFSPSKLPVPWVHKAPYVSLILPVQRLRQSPGEDNHGTVGCYQHVLEQEMPISYRGHTHSDYCSYQHPIIFLSLDLALSYTMSLNPTSSDFRKRKPCTIDYSFQGHMI